MMDSGSGWLKKYGVRLEGCGEDLTWLGQRHWPSIFYLTFYMGTDPVQVALGMVSNHQFLFPEHFRIWWQAHKHQQTLIYLKGREIRRSNGGRGGNHRFQLLILLLLAFFSLIPNLSSFCDSWHAQCHGANTSVWLRWFKRPISMRRLMMQCCLHWCLETCAGPSSHARAGEPCTELEPHAFILLFKSMMILGSLA